MNIERFLLKEPFYLRSPRDGRIKRTHSFATDKGKIEIEVDNAKKTIVDQSRFLDELYPHAHDIYCFDFTSAREKYEMKDGKPVFAGWADYHKSSLPMQWFLRRHKASIAFSADPKFFQEYNSALDNEMLTAVKAQWNTAGMTFRQHMIGKSLYGTADAAVVEYVKDGQIHSKVFSYENDEVLNYIDNPFTGEQVGVRVFYWQSVKCVELWFGDRVEIWMDDEDQGRGINEKRAYQELGFKKIGRKSEDGYVKIYEEYHMMGECPFTYFRAKGPIWSPAQPIIEEVESLISDIMEAGALFFHPIIFFQGMVMSLPNINDLHKTLASKTTDGDAKFLNPPPISSSFEFTYNERMKTIFDSTGTVILHPEELKSGTDSMGYVEMLYNEEKQSAEDTYAEQFDSFQKLHRIHKKCVGIVMKKPSDYESFLYTTEMNINIPENSYTKAQKLALEVQAKFKSRETATEEINGSPFETNRLKVQDQYDIQLEADKAAATSQATQPGTTELVVGESLQE